ncbi:MULTISPECIES: hypothetical protein [Gammaproteobacteria]|uniref:hypothetical protein n=1 Tax=Gammaproteobacteria TaxID=1236 RepID=UPI0037BCB234
MFNLEDLLFWLRQCALLALLVASCAAFGALGFLFMYATDDTLSVMLWIALFCPAAGVLESARMLVKGHRK